MDLPVVFDHNHNFFCIIRQFSCITWQVIFSLNVVNVPVGCGIPIMSPNTYVLVAGIVNTIISGFSVCILPCPVC